MQPNPVSLRCFMERSGDLWVASCVDLTLAAQHEDKETAKAKLIAQIEDYVHFDPQLNGCPSGGDDRKPSAGAGGSQIVLRRHWPSVLHYHWVAMKSVCGGGFRRMLGGAKAQEGTQRPVTFSHAVE